MYIVFKRYRGDGYISLPWIRALSHSPQLGDVRLQKHAISQKFAITFVYKKSPFPGTESHFKRVQHIVAGFVFPERVVAKGLHTHWPGETALRSTTFFLYSFRSALCSRG